MSAQPCRLHEEYAERCVGCVLRNLPFALTHNEEQLLRELVEPMYFAADQSPLAELAARAGTVVP